MLQISYDKKCPIYLIIISKIPQIPIVKYSQSLLFSLSQMRLIYSCNLSLLIITIIIKLDSGTGVDGRGVDVVMVVGPLVVVLLAAAAATASAVLVVVAVEVMGRGSGHVLLGIDGLDGRNGVDRVMVVGAFVVVVLVLVLLGGRGRTVTVITPETTGLHLVHLGDILNGIGGDGERQDGESAEDNEGFHFAKETIGLCFAFINYWPLLYRATAYDLNPHWHYHHRPINHSKVSGVDSFNLRFNPDFKPEGRQKQVK